MHRKNYLSLLAVSLSLVIATSLANAQGPTLPSSKEAQDQQFKGFNLEGYSESGEKSWDVKGDTADIQGSEVILSNVNANSYGKQKINVTAEKGTIDQTSGKMHLETDVVVTSEDGSQMVTDSLDWDRDKDLVTTKDEVMIMDARMTATGIGLEAQPGLKTAQLNEDVMVNVNTELDKQDSDVVTITSDGPMVIDQAKQFATFEDNVVAIRQNQTLKADLMEVFFNEDMSDIKKMICTGNVEIFQGENRTFANKAIFDNEAQKLTLLGRPKMRMIVEGEGAITSP